MASKRDYYDVLDISRNATEEEVRKAFRQKALQYHPDRNKDPGALDQFKEINEAYQVLTDPKRRQQYDQWGHAGMGGQAGQGFEGFSGFEGFGDIFEAFFGGAGFGGTSTRTRPQTTPGADLKVDLRINFKESIFGADKEIRVHRTEPCSSCDGSRSQPGSEPLICGNCKGSGQVRRTQRSIFGQFVQEVACTSCNGLGELVTNPCSQCRGSGVERKDRKLQVDVPAGVEDGITLQLRGEGETGQFSGPPGDLYILLKVDPDKIFKRSQQDILLEREITFPQAALGAKVKVPTIEGEEVLQVPPGTQHGALFRLKGLGVPQLRNPSKRGDQVIRVNIVTPKNLNKRQRELLEEFKLTLQEEIDD